MMTRKEKAGYIELLGVLNPFAFRTRGGALVRYSSPREAYSECLKSLWSEFPRGFIDIPLFMEKYQGLGLKQAEALCGRKQYALVRLWDTSDKDRTAKLCEVLLLLLKVSEVPLSNDFFLQALRELDAFIERRSVGARTEEGSIVNFIQIHYDGNK